MKMWAILVIVAAGIVFGSIEPGRLTYAFGHATLYVFLPPLVFEAAWNLNYRALKRQWLPIAALAGPGVVLTAAIIAGALGLVGIPIASAALAGAILSATDPIAVVAIFRRLKVPQTLATIIESEALFNDAVAVVLYRGVLAALAGGVTSRAIALHMTLALLGAGGGIVLGLGLAWAVAALLHGRTAARLQIAATLLCAYATYFLGEWLGLSGIFTVISFGIALRWYERAWVGLRIADDVNRFWDVAAIVANGLVFFLVGAALHISVVVAQPVFVLAAIAGVAVSRLAVSGLLWPAGFPRQWLDVVRVAGVRGALCLALALALPPSVPYREAIIDATFAVTLGSLLGSGSVIPLVIRRLIPARRKTA